MELLSVQEYKHLAPQVVQDMQEWGFRDAKEVDRIMSGSQENYVLPTSIGFSDNAVTFDDIASYALRQWYKHIGLAAMIQRVMENTGWNRRAWTQITQIHMVCVWPDLYAKARGHGPVDREAFEVACYLHDGIHEVIEMEF